METEKVVFIFRRDLRVYDNLALTKAVRFCKKHELKLVLAFVFSPIQIKKNKYFSSNAFRFMLECLDELNKEYTIHFYNQDNFYKNIPNLRAICFNRDYTPYAIQRDKRIETYCINQKITLLTEEDYTLHPMKSICTASQTPYKVFGAFYRQASKLSSPQKPQSTPNDLLEVVVGKSLDSESLLESYLKQYPVSSEIKGGRHEGLKILERIKNGNFDDYMKTRDNPTEDTTRLGAYLKFGCLSIREAYHTIKKRPNSEGLIRQLYWKEFYANVSFFFPETLDGMVNQDEKTNMEMNPEMRNRIQWVKSEDHFEKWCQGMTGYPFVDAGMRQLNTTGFMHNRLRMVTASFLIKDLHMDWRLGEKYFASKLIDYDPASNNGGWQWVAGTGTDASPYFRVFNPSTQHKQFDPLSTYVKKWIPELSDVPVNDILNWDTKYVKYKHINYPKPLVDHKIEAKKVLDMYK